MLKPNSNTVDVGCNRGSVLSEILALAPQGQHWAFEPIPRLYNLLKRRFPTVQLFQTALAASPGQVQFNYFRDMDGFSGLVRRQLDVDPGRVELLTVETQPLDEMFPIHLDLHLIKIDVEGAELGVLTGAKNLLRRCRPVVVFECGKGGLDLYQQKPEEVYDLLVSMGYRLQPLAHWNQNGPGLSRDEFHDRFWNSPEYMYVADL